MDTRSSPLPTPETKTPSLSSVYALSKYDQERLCLITGRAYNMPAVALSAFSTCSARGRRCPIPTRASWRSSRRAILNNKRPLIFRGRLPAAGLSSACTTSRRPAVSLLKRRGRQARSSTWAAASRMPLSQIAERMASALNCEHLTPEITGQYRVGDIRHCFADISHARRRAGLQSARHAGRRASWNWPNGCKGRWPMTAWPKRAPN